MSSVWVLLQLVFGFAVVLAPGALLARTIGVRSMSATLAWALALVFAALAVTFVVHGSLTLTLVAPPRRRASPPSSSASRRAVRETLC